jgi:hypothetical protein
MTTRIKMNYFKFTIRCIFGVSAMFSSTEYGGEAEHEPPQQKIKHHPNIRNIFLQKLISLIAKD